MTSVSDIVKELVFASSKDRPITKNVLYEAVLSRKGEVDNAEVKSLANAYIRIMNTGKDEPAVQVKKVQKFNIIDESHLAGGSKSRVAMDLLQTYVDDGHSGIVTWGLSTGWGQVALSIAATQLKFPVTIFIDTPLNGQTDVTSKALDVSSRKYATIISNDNPQAAAKSFATNRVKFMELGFNTTEFRNLLREKLHDAFVKWDPDYQETMRNKRIWVVWGSGGIARTLYELFPNSPFSVVQIGKAIKWEDFDVTRTTLYFSSKPTQYQLKHRFSYAPISDKAGSNVFPSTWRNADERSPMYGRVRWQGPRQVTTVLPPYPSVSTYDAKLWRFLKVDGRPGDYVFNVAADA